jgi:hypothetical protein
MKIFSPTFILIAFAALANATQTPNQLALEVIKQDFSPAYNPENSSKEELIKAAAINSRLALNHLMSSNQVSEEIRVCYAIRLINDKLGRLIMIKSSTATLPEEKEWIKKRDLLAERLLQIQNAAEQGAAANP